MRCCVVPTARSTRPSNWGAIASLAASAGDGCDELLRARGETTESFPDAPHATSSWPAKAGHPCLCCQHIEKTWMPTCVGMTMWKQPLRHVEHYFPANYTNPR